MILSYEAEKYWALDSLKQVSQSINQITSSFSSSFTTFATVFISLLAYKRFVTTAKCWTVQCLKTFFKSLIYNKNNNWPTAEPRSKTQPNTLISEKIRGMYK